MKHKPGDRLRRVLDEQVGEVLVAEHKRWMAEGQLKETEWYWMKFPQGDYRWMQGHQVKAYYAPMTPVKLEDEALCDMVIIDACLKNRAFEALRGYAKGEGEEA
ncbi:hypothetical protein [Salibacterium lacus]|uniref:Uncharacterized protein n=1 Tax=Salibacterium lacus TaxID=1898109 RepID=A0ABW5SWU0_9BACI